MERVEKTVCEDVNANDIFSMMDRESSQTIVCFRCGEVGHIRMQCMNYKVRLCDEHEATGRCARKEWCSFAHGASELREPWKQRCVRVVKNGNELVCIGCNSTEHTFRKCPLHKDLIPL